jgi:thiosulfate reductase cytochrome b subunit
LVKVGADKGQWFVILTGRMYWLFAAFVVSLCALLWAVVAVARHIRRDRQQLPAEAAAASETEVKQDNL